MPTHGPGTRRKPGDHPWTPPTPCHTVGVESGARSSLGRILLGFLRRFLIPAIGWTLSVSAARALDRPLHPWGVVACLAGVHAAYVFDALADSGRLRRLFSDPRLIDLICCGLAMGAAVLVDPTLIPPIALLSLLGIGYIPLKRVIPKNLLTAASWVLCVLTLSLHDRSLDPAILCYGLALLLILLANANLCDLPDVATDRRNRVLGLTPILGPALASRVAGVLAVIGCAAALRLGAWPIAVPGTLFAVIGLAGGLGFAAHPERRWILDAALVTAGPLSLLDAWLRG